MNISDQPTVLSSSNVFAKKGSRTLLSKNALQAVKCRNLDTIMIDTEKKIGGFGFTQMRYRKRTWKEDSERVSKVENMIKLALSLQTAFRGLENPAKLLK